ncbi:hypothetical protein G5714_005020 [Onychostoma macrolepis]|uniref:C2 domain-containing protein n=1 Tax=Onychostoma macrolepis TaxID=369639 RepID=A0A7J6D6B3_9TELE|nr:hypothetical protein G5714_005020 [Onychostoma macrolepis]
MVVFYNLGLVSLAVLMLVSQLDFASAAVRVFGLHARDLTGDPAGNNPDPYVKVWCGSNFGGMTEFRKDNANPSWSAEFNFPNCKTKDDLKFQVWDKDLNFDDHLGTCQRRLDFASAAVRVFGLHARDLTGDPAGNKPDPYLKVWCGSTFGGQTEYRKDTAHPTWSAEFNFPNCKVNETLKLEVWDKDLNFDDHLGTCTKQVQYGSFTITCYLKKGTVFYRLVSLAMLILASQLDFASAAVRVSSIYARGLTGDPFGNQPDPYIKVWCGSTFGGQTEYQRDTANPSWSAEFSFPNCRVGANLKLEVWDKDLIFDDYLGTCTKTLSRGVFNAVCSLNAGTLYYTYNVQ